jgi:hypothetical protein
MDVSRIALEPSRSVVQISQLPERLDGNATRRPSGESCGVESFLVEEIATAGGEEARAPGAGTSTRQILVSWKLRT